MTNNAPDTTPRTGHTLTYAAGVAVVVALLATATTLGLKGWQPADIAALLTAIAAPAGALVAVIGQLVGLIGETRAQTERLVKIDHQTNGVLTQRIHDAVRAELDKPIPYALPGSGSPVVGPGEPKP